MYNQCEIVQDLLPLYVDGACSESSAAMVRDHLASCSQCKVLYEKLCSDSGEEILKAEMDAVVAKHERQVKRKRLLTITTSVVITSVIALIVICLLVWRLWPQPFSDLLPTDEDAIICFSAYTREKGENGSIYDRIGYDISCRGHAEGSCNDPSEILDILATFSYQQDFRNLFPVELDTVRPDEHYDGRFASVDFYTGIPECEYFSIDFLTSGIILVFVRGQEEFRVYHPTSQNTFDMLIEYIQTHSEPVFFPQPKFE